MLDIERKKLEKQKKETSTSYYPVSQDKKEFVKKNLKAMLKSREKKKEEEERSNEKMEQILSERSDTLHKTDQQTETTTVVYAIPFVPQSEETAS